MLRLRITRLHNRLFGAGASKAANDRRGSVSERQRTSHWLSLALTLGFGLPLLTAYGVLLGTFLPAAYGAGPGGSIAMASSHVGVSMIAALLLSLGLANKDLNRLAGDLEWLLTLPISISALYAMRAAERTVLNAYAWVLVYPLLLAMLGRGQLSWLAVGAALLISLPLFLLVAFAYLLVESAARLWLPRVLINSLQFFGTLVGLGLLVTIPTRPQWTAPLSALPWPAVSQAVSLALSDGSSSASAVLWHALRYTGETAALLGSLYFLVRLVTARGAVVGGGAARGRRGLALAPLGRGLARGLLGRELLLLARDKKTLHLALILPSVLLVPLVMIAHSDRGAPLLASVTHLPALALWAGSISVFSATNLLQNEGKSLWLLFTLPRSLARMLAARAVVWLPVSLGFAGLVLAYGASRQPISMELVFGSGYCLLGLALLTVLGAGLGLGTLDHEAIDSERASQRGGPQVMLLGVLLVAFASGLYGDAWLRVSLLVLLGALVYGVWQDASRRLPFLLEPELQPAPQVGVSDALACALLILVLEVFGAELARTRFALRPWPAQALAFVAATSLVAAGAGLVFWRRGVRGVRSFLGLVPGERALRRGLSWALPAVAVALIFALAVQRWPWLGAGAEASALAGRSLEQPSDLVILLLSTWVGAPLVEELLFRGLLYRALRQSLSPRTSGLFAAVVFAAFHPGIACIPVVLLSLLAAASFERSRSLVSPIVVHAAYNVTLFLASATLLRA